MNFETHDFYVPGRWLEAAAVDALQGAINLWNHIEVVLDASQRVAEGLGWLAGCLWTWAGVWPVAEGSGRRPRDARSGLPAGVWPSGGGTHYVRVIAVLEEAAGKRCRVEQAVGRRRPDAAVVRARAEAAEVRDEVAQGGMGWRPTATAKPRPATGRAGRDLRAEARDLLAEQRDRAAGDDRRDILPVSEPRPAWRPADRTESAR